MRLTTLAEIDMSTDVTVTTLVSGVGEKAYVQVAYDLSVLEAGDEISITLPASAFVNGWSPQTGTYTFTKDYSRRDLLAVLNFTGAWVTTGIWSGALAGEFSIPLDLTGAEINYLVFTYTEPKEQTDLGDFAMEINGTPVDAADIATDAGVGSYASVTFLFDVTQTEANDTLTVTLPESATTHTSIDSATVTLSGPGSTFNITNYLNDNDIWTGELLGEFSASGNQIVYTYDYIQQQSDIGDAGMVVDIDLAGYSTEVEPGDATTQAQFKLNYTIGATELSFRLIINAPGSMTVGGDTATFDETAAAGSYTIAGIVNALNNDANWSSDLIEAGTWSSVGDQLHYTFDADGARTDLEDVYFAIERDGSVDTTTDAGVGQRAKVRFEHLATGLAAKDKVKVTLPDTATVSNKAESYEYEVPEGFAAADLVTAMNDDANWDYLLRGTFGSSGSKLTFEYDYSFDASLAAMAMAVTEYDEMFDGDVTTQTEEATISRSFTIDDTGDAYSKGGYCLGLFNIEATEIQVAGDATLLTESGDTLITESGDTLITSEVDQTIDLSGTDIEDMAIYMPIDFGGAEKINFDLTITNSGGNAKCGLCVVGFANHIALTKWDVTVGISDYSKITLDDFGRLYLKQGNFAKRGEISGITYDEDLDWTYNKVVVNRSTGCVIDYNEYPEDLTERHNSSSQYECLVIYGFTEDFTLRKNGPSIADIVHESRGLLR